MRLTSQLDVNGELTASIARMQAWLAGQTGGPKLRLDTYQGQPDITFVRTSLAPGMNIRQYVERLGFTNPKKLYLMYAGSYPQEAVWPRERWPQSRVRLPLAHVPVAERQQIRLLEVSAMHEILHALGAVPEGAPHWVEGNHVTDTSDVMQPSFAVDSNGEVAEALRPGPRRLLRAQQDPQTDCRRQPVSGLESAVGHAAAEAAGRSGRTDQGAAWPGDGPREGEQRRRRSRLR